MVFVRRHPIIAIAAVATLAVVAYVAWALFFGGGTHFDPEMR